MELIGGFVLPPGLARLPQAECTAATWIAVDARETKSNPKPPVKHALLTPWPSTGNGMGRVRLAESQKFLGQEHSMDRYLSRPKLSENFQHHWSIPVSVGKLIWTNHWSIPFPGVWTNGPESSSKASPYTGIGSWMALSRIPGSLSELPKLQISDFPLSLPTFNLFWN